jgi:predicted dehydrogenase
VKVLIVGLGSIGTRHLTNIKLLSPTAEIVVLRRHSSRDGDTPDGLETAHVVHSMDDALETCPDLAIVSNPASVHIQTAMSLAQADVDLFLEKPISDKMTGVDALLRECHERSLILMVGYNLRFCRPLQVLQRAVTDGRIGRVMRIRAEVGQFLPDWRPGADYRQGGSARRELGGGVVLELSHELDYVRWLGGDVRSVSAQLGHLSDLEIDVEDNAEIILEFESGIVGSVHLDMVERVPGRTCRVVGTEGTVVWDGSSNRVRQFLGSVGVWTDLHPAEMVDRNVMYLEEIEHFLECVRTRRRPLITGDDARDVLSIANAAKESSAARRVIDL